MTTIGSLEGDSSNGDNGDNNKNGNNKDDDKNKDNNDDVDEKKEYAFQIVSDRRPSADPDSVDGMIFAGEKNIERNNAKTSLVRDSDLPR
jgi:hypothetical protein